MMMNRKAQSFLEYSLLIGCVVAALMAMNVYFKRGITGVIKVSQDDLATPAIEANVFSDAQDQQIVGNTRFGRYIEISPAITTRDAEIVTTERARGERQFVINRDTVISNERWRERNNITFTEDYLYVAPKGVNPINPVGQIEEGK